MKSILATLFVIISLLVSVKESAKILAVIPTPSISHQVPFRPLLHELARRGHQVTVITTDPAFPKGKAPQNLTEIDIHDAYDIFRKGFLKHVKGNKGDLFSVFKAGNAVMFDVLDYELQQEEVKKIINGNEKYDLLILEAYLTGILAFAHKFQAPVIQMSSLGAFLVNSEIFGIPVHPILYPQPPIQRVYNLTLWEKIKQAYNYYRIGQLYDESEKGQEIVMRKHFGEDLPPMAELRNKAEMLFLNFHPVFEGNYPIPPSVVYLWGIDKKPEKEIPQDLKSFLDSSKHGVIYFSFGTNVDPANLPPNTIEIFIKVLSQLPYDVLWKWSKDELPGKSDNIRIGKWFPQSDLLRHPKVKLFITQGGLQSTDEAITAGVPLIGIPMLWDQWYNVEKFVHFGIGEKLDIESITERNFKKAVETVIGSNSYRKNIVKLRDLMQDEPQPPLQRAVWWVEYVLRHGGARQLRAPAANISWAQYYEVELLLTILVGIIVVLSIIAYSLYFVYTLVIRKSSSKVKSKKQ